MTERAAPAAIFDEFEDVKQRSLWLDAFERLIRNKAAMMGLIIAIGVVIAAIFGGWLAPRDYLKTNIQRIAETPNSDYYLGTDLVGRDVLSRLLHGARTAVFVAVVTIVISNAIGIVVGAAAGYLGGKVDDLIMRVTDVLFSFPDLLFAAFLSVTIRNPVVDMVSRLRVRTGWGILEETIYLDYLILFRRPGDGQLAWNRPSYQGPDTVAARAGLHSGRGGAGPPRLAHYQKAPDSQLDGSGDRVYEPERGLGDALRVLP